VLLRGAAQLFAAVFERPLCQQVHHATPGLAEPVERHAAVDESQRLDAVGITLRGSPFGDAAHGLLLALRNPRRGYLDAAHTQFFQQQPGDGEFFAGVERNPRRLLAAARAIENQLFVVSCNACGERDGTLYGGFSRIIDPLGAVLAQGGGEEEIVTADLDLSSIAPLRKAVPVFHDRRPELYRL